MARAFVTTEIYTLEDLRGFVERIICERQHLLLGAFQLQEKALGLHGRLWGLHFIMNGPRAVQYSAIWDATRHTILFYDCNGERFHKCVLTASPELREELTGLARMKLAA